MKIKGTMERLVNHMDVLAELKSNPETRFRAIIEVERFIKQDTDDLKVAIMTHAFDALDYFNVKIGTYVNATEAS